MTAEVPGPLVSCWLTCSKAHSNWATIQMTAHWAHITNRWIKPVQATEPARQFRSKWGVTENRNVIGVHSSFFLSAQRCRCYSDYRGTHSLYHSVTYHNHRRIGKWSWVNCYFTMYLAKPCSLTMGYNLNFLLLLVQWISLQLAGYQPDIHTEKALLGCVPDAVRFPEGSFAG